ncbi:hypothetical protein IJ670_05640, partial [bacterium]|nr:hypothetical protein [bacterium]
KTLDLTKPKPDVERHLRALYPWALAWIDLGDRFLKVEKYVFLKDDNYKDKKPYDIVKTAKHYCVIKGFDFLIKVLR